MRTAEEEHIFELGRLQGIKEMEGKLLKACNDGIPIVIAGRAWFVRSDIQNLRDLFSSLE